MMEKKRGQVWIETVIYTLIAFALIGLVLAFVKPKIEEIQDRSLIEQSLTVMEDINTLMKTLNQGAPGNKRLIELGIKKGILKIDGTKDQFIFEIESKSIYSEPGAIIQEGNILVQTRKQGDLNLVTLTRDYWGIYNITYNGKDDLQVITKSPSPHKLFFSNKGGINNNIDITFG